MEHQIKHLGEENSFVLMEDGEMAAVVYEIVGDEMAILHTIVPEKLNGKGIGSALVKSALDFCRKANLKVDPVCPFAKAYIQNHKEYQDLVH